MRGGAIELKIGTFKAEYQLLLPKEELQALLLQEINSGENEIISEQDEGNR